MSDPLRPSTVLDPVVPSAGSRLKFWLVGVVAAAVVGAGAVATSATGSESGEGSDEYAAAIESTSALEGYRLRFSQRTESGDWVAELGRSGSSFSATIRVGRGTSETRFVDGRYYELEDDRWHLKPAPARDLAPPTDLTDLTNDLRALPAIEVDRRADAVILQITCGNDDRPNVGETVKHLCDDQVETYAVVDLQRGLVTRIEGEGRFEVWPGHYEDGSATIEIEPLASVEPIVAPESFDVDRASCIGEQLGTSDYVEMSQLIDDLPTAQNLVMFNTCGFRFYPRGADFADD